MFRAILCLVSILSISSHDIHTCIQQADHFHRTQLKFNTGSKYLVHPTLTVSLKNQEIHRASKCFVLAMKTDAANPNKLTKKNHFLHVYLKDVWHEYSVKREYHFVEPKVSAKCNCYCKHTPRCGRHYNSPNKLNGTCNTETNYGIYIRKRYTCENSGRSGSVCCNVTVKGDYAHKLHAIYMEMRRTHYDVQIALIDNDGREISSDNSVKFSTDSYHVPFYGGSGVMRVSDYGQFDKLPAQWASVHPERPSEIRINGQGFNDVYETSVGKVGWYKWTSEGKFRTAHRKQIERAFTPIVRDCDENRMDWRFHANGWQGHREDGDLLHEYYADFVDTVEYDSERKMVKIRDKRQTGIKVDIDFEVRLERVFVRGDSNFSTFDARYDARTNELVVDVRDAYGELRVAIFNAFSTEHCFSQTFVVPTLTLRNFTRIFQLRGNNEWDTSLRACLTASVRNSWHCIDLAKSKQTRFPYYDFLEANGSSNEKQVQLTIVIFFVFFVIKVLAAAI